MMSNDSNRDARTTRPSELQASDFFPPGHGWNKDDETPSAANPRKPNAEVDDDQDAMTGRPPRMN